MSNTHALSLALEQAEKQRDEAQAAYQRIARAAEGARQQAQQLLDYRGEYQQRWSAQFKRAGTIEILQCYQGFMGRLNTAIEQQDAAVQRTAAQVEAARQALLDRETRVAAIRKLIERRQEQAEAAQARREQKATDEQASRLAWNRRADGPGLGLGDAFALA